MYVSFLLAAMLLGAAVPLASAGIIARPPTEMPGRAVDEFCQSGGLVGTLFPVQKGLACENLHGDPGFGFAKPCRPSSSNFVGISRTVLYAVHHEAKNTSACRSTVRDQLNATHVAFEQAWSQNETPAEDLDAICTASGNGNRTGGWCAPAYTELDLCEFARQGDCPVTPRRVLG